MKKVKRNKPLADRYQKMVDAGLISPANVPDRFVYPSMFVDVPSVTTYGVHDFRGLGEEVSAQLERDIKTN